MGSSEASDVLAARQPTWLAHTVNHGQWIKPVAKLCRVATTAAHPTFAGSWHRVVHQVGVLRGCRGVRRAGAGQQASGGSLLAICRRSLARIGRKPRQRVFGT